MFAKIGRGSLAILTMVALIALIVSVAACSDDKATTTTTTGSTVSTTTETTAPQVTDSTVVVGGKTLDDYRAEIPELEKALQTDPSDRSSLEKLAVAHYQLFEYEKAEAAYLKILAIAEDAFTRNNLGNVYRDWGKFEDAKAAYRKAIETDPTLKYPYVNLAGVMQREGDLEGAHKLLEEGAQKMSAEDKGMLEAADERLTTTTT